MNGVNPDLPILEELGLEFEAMVGAELGEPAVPARRERARLPRRTPPAPRRRQARRVARRASIVLVLLCLVGGVALAARFASGGGGAAADTSPTLLGRDAGQGWRLSAYRDRGRLCFLFTAGGELSSDCGAEPSADGLRVSSAIASGHRFVIGLTGARVDAVAIRIGEAQAGAATSPVVDAGAARDAGVPTGTRWFVVALEPSGADALAPAQVVAVDSDHRRLGPAYVDCSLGVVGPACERRIRARAARAGH